MAEISLLVSTTALDQDLECGIVVGRLGQRSTGDLQIELSEIPAIDMADEVGCAQLKGLAGNLHRASLPINRRIARAEWLEVG